MRASRRRLAALVAGFTLVSLPFAAVADGGPHVLFRIQPSEVDESSSLVVSQTHPGLVYTANDSGDAATVYVLDDQTGELVGTTSIEGVDPLDIEAMTPGGHGSLIVADIGDNDSQRAYTTVYRIPEPDVGTNTVTAKAVRVTYANGPHNAEAVVYSVATGRLYIASKQFAGAHVYRSPPHFFAHRQVVMRAVAKAPALATDAALLPDGDVAVIRTYFSAFFYTFPGWRALADRELPHQPQGESLAVPDSGGVMWIGSEGVHSRVIAVQVPDLTPTTPPPTTSPPTTSGSASGGTADVEDQHREQLKSQAVAIGAGALALFVIVIVAIAVRWRRHPHVEEHRQSEDG